MENQYESTLRSVCVGRVKECHFNRDGSSKPNNFLLLREIIILNLLHIHEWYFCCCCYKLQNVGKMDQNNFF